MGHGLLPVLVILLSLLAGCAGLQMPPLDHAPLGLHEGRSIYLMTLTVTNSYKDFQPEVDMIHVDHLGAGGSVDRMRFDMDKRGAPRPGLPAAARRYLVRFELEDGRYVLKGVTSLWSTFLLRGQFFAPIHADIVARGPGVFYLGHVQCNVRERMGDEFKAGPTIPLIDQALVGASGGTFDVTVRDDWAIDESLFRGTFPALRGADVQSAVLSPIDRARAQKWWSENLRIW